MIAEYLEAEHKGGGKDYINIEVRVKADCVHAFASSVRDATVDRVLEIIDAESWSYCDYIIKHENGNADKQSAACHLSENIRDAVMALKGGDKK